MKQTHVLTAVCAFVSVLTAAQVAVAGEQGIQSPGPGQQQAMLIALNGGSQPVPPAEWRADRYLAIPSLNGAVGQEPRAQASAEPMIPAEWRADHFLATPSVADASDHRVQKPEMSIGSC